MARDRVGQEVRNGNLRDGARARYRVGGRRTHSERERARGNGSGPRLRARTDQASRTFLATATPTAMRIKQHDDLLHRNSPLWSSPSGSTRIVSPFVTAWHPPVLFEERLRASRPSLVVARRHLGHHLLHHRAPRGTDRDPGLVREHRSASASTVIRIDTERIWVGRRSAAAHRARLLDTVDRATNPWPWRVFNNRYLGGNPIWTRDSVGIRGRDGKRRSYWLSRRAPTGATNCSQPSSTPWLTARARSASAAAAAYVGRPLPPPGWYDDPWDAHADPLVGRQQWTGYAAVHPAAATSNPPAPGGVTVIPIADETPVRRFPVVTISLIALCVVVFFAIQPTHSPPEHLINPGFERITSRSCASSSRMRDPVRDREGSPAHRARVQRHVPRRRRLQRVQRPRAGQRHNPHKIVYLALMASLFLHATPAAPVRQPAVPLGLRQRHRAPLGPPAVPPLYLIGGIVASLTHVLVDPNSTVPMIGASGAIAAVMGAYLICYPSTRVKTIIFFGPMLLRKVKAVWLLLVWLALQPAVRGRRLGHRVGRARRWLRVRRAARTALAPARSRSHASDAVASRNKNSRLIPCRLTAS